MICEIAKLGVDVPDIGDLAVRCKPYLSDIPADIVIDKDKMRPDIWPNLSENDNYYLDTGFSFYRQLLNYDGFMLHSSAVVYEGKAYLFSGPCGIGKSTHAQLWIEHFGNNAVIINDDKPALRYMDGKWYAFGTPWCGKDGINLNAGAPLAGICFLHRGDTHISRLTPLKALPLLLRQSNGRNNVQNAEKLMYLINRLVENIPIFEFYNHASESDATVTYEAFKKANERL